MDQQPTIPPGPRTPAARSSHSRTFSFHSDKSGGSKNKIPFADSPREKEQRDRIWNNESKANPNAAINEAQPGDAAILERATIQPLRGVEHKDADGNLIADPDRSNPTRPRFERPLDTIRSFERAIDQGYKRRATGNRSVSYEQPQPQASRRNSSYVGGYYDGHRQSQVGGGYYGNQHADGYANGPQGPNGMNGPAGMNGPPRPRPGHPRMASESSPYGYRPYGQSGYQQSQNTMSTDVTHASDSTGPWASHTDPSSENSSDDRISPAPKHHLQDGPGPNGYGGNGGKGFGGPIMEELGPGAPNMYPSGLRQGVNAPPAPPPHDQRRPIQLGRSEMPPPSTVPAARQASPEKKKSRLSRLFGKSSS